MKFPFSITPKELQSAQSVMAGIVERAKRESLALSEELGLEMILARNLGWCQIGCDYMRTASRVEARVLGNPSLRFVSFHLDPDSDQGRVPFPNVAVSLDAWEKLFRFHGDRGDGYLHHFTERAEWWLACYSSREGDFRTGMWTYARGRCIAMIAAIEETGGVGGEQA